MGSSKPPPSGGGAGDLSSEAADLAIYLTNVGLVIAFVVAMWKRAAKTQRNKEECRQLRPRVAWLRDLQRLLPADPPEPTTGSVAVDIRAVLAKMLEATLKEAEERVEACARTCCLSRFARCYRHGRQLDGVSKSLDEVCGHILPVISQIDTSQRLLLVLDLMRLQVSQDGPKSATLLSETHRARTDGENNDVSERQAAPDEHGLQ